mgnify:CR=1 FL=1
MKRFLFSFFGLCLAISLHAQPCTNRTTAEHDIATWRMVRVEYDNDWFAGTNRYYTHGLRAEVIAPKLFYLYTSKLLLRWGKRSRTFYGLAVDQDLFTPQALTTDYQDNQDRPFAGTLQLSNFMISNLRDQRMRFLTEVQIGVLGPLAGGRFLAAGDSLWDEQIGTDLLLGYRARLEKGVFESNGVDFSAYGEAQVQTVRTYAELGGILRAGRLNPPFYDLDFAVKSLRAGRPIHDVQVYLFAEGNVRFVGYDATLQGGLINGGSPYTFSGEDLRRFQYRGAVGLQAVIKSVGIGYRHSFWSPTFQTGQAHSWGQVRVWVAW